MIILTVEDGKYMRGVAEVFSSPAFNYNLMSLSLPQVLMKNKTSPL